MKIVFIKSKPPQPDNQTFIHCCVVSNDKFYESTGKTKEEALKLMLKYMNENISNFCKEGFENERTLGN